MAQTIKLKRSSTGGAVPSTSSLSLGEVAINTYDGKMYIKKNDGSDAIVEIGAGNGEAVWNSYDYTATSSQTSFSGSDNNSETLSYVPNFLQVFLNGILLDPAVDYAATTGNSIVLTVGATTSDLIQIETFTQIIGTGDILVDTFPVSSTQTAFTLSQDPVNKSNISVYVEGVYQESSTYSLSATTLTLSESPANGTTVEVVIGTRNVTLDGIVDLTISGTLHAGALDLGDANIINVNEISLDTIKGDADANTNITFAGNDVTTFTQGGQERLRLNTTGAQVTGNIVVSGNVDGRDVAADGVTADAALPRTGGAMGGAITTNSTFDGRDVSVDGTKLDTIEVSATADQTDVEIRAAVESASDSNVFTNADHSKLDAIEALADVTDATNVTAAGALMDSEVTNLAQVKAFDSSDYATAAQGTTANAALPKAGGTMTGALTVKSPSATGEQLILKIENAVSTGAIGKITFNQTNDEMHLSNEASGSLVFDIATVEKMRIDTLGNVLFGNGNSHSPKIQGTTNSGRTPGSPGYSFNDDLDTGMFQPVSTPDTVAFSTGGTERLRIKTHQATLVSEQLDQLTLLHVKKDVDSFIMKVENDGNSAGTSGASYADASDGLWVDTRWNTATNTPFKVTSNSGTSPMMIIKGNGNVGIGTASPEKNLSIGSSQAEGIQFNYDTTNNYRNQILNYWNSSADSRMDFNVARASGATPINYNVSWL